MLFFKRKGSINFLLYCLNSYLFNIFFYNKRMYPNASLLVSNKHREGDKKYVITNKKDILNMIEFS